MFHMHSTFDLSPGTSLGEFQHAWDKLCEVLVAEDLMVSASGIAARRPDTPLDTDDACPLGYFTVMSFRDRAQSEAAWEAFEAKREPVWSPHVRVLRMVSDAIFACWEDVPASAQPGE